MNWLAIDIGIEKQKQEQEDGMTYPLSLEGLLILHHIAGEKSSRDRLATKSTTPFDEC